jgi:hypothetical protein
MEKRIVRLEKNAWRIRTEAGEIPESERADLVEYLDEIKMPHFMLEGCLCIPGKVIRNLVFERLEHFYDGRMEVLPF